MMEKQKGKQVTFGASPRVDLLPEKQRAEQLHEKTLGKMLLVLIGSAVVAGLIWFAGTFPVQAADERLAALETESQQLTSQLADYSEIQRFINGVNQISSLRQTITENEVLVMELHDEVADSLPQSVEINNFVADFEGSDTESGGDSGSELLCGQGVATLTIGVVSDSLIPAAELIAALSEVTGYECANLAESARTADEYHTAITLVVGEEALSGRFSEGEGDGE